MSVLSNNSKRVQVSFNERQWKLINELRGEVGSTDSEIIRNIVIAWLSEKSLLSTCIKSRMSGSEKI